MSEIYATTELEKKYLEQIYKNTVVLDHTKQRVYITKIDKDKYKARFVVRGDYQLEFVPGNNYFDIYIHKDMPTKEMNRLVNHLCQHLKVKKTMSIQKKKSFPFVIYRQKVPADGFPMKITSYFLMMIEQSQREVVRRQMMQAVMPFTE